jgi:acetyltransferase-like isoleucine patch superfamily enzyme
MPSATLGERRSPITIAEQAKKRLMGLVPPKPWSEAWLERRGMLVMGRHSYAPPSFVRMFDGDSVRVIIGNFCSLATAVEIMPGGNHRTDTVTTYPLLRRLRREGMGEADPESIEAAGQPWSKGDVVIGNDVWIGQGAKILGGLTIGDGAVVAAWSVVTKNVPPYAIVAGVPARVVRQRFSPETVASLLRIRWWEWEDGVIVERIDELTSPDLAAFIHKYDPTLASPGHLSTLDKDRGT